MFSFHSFKSSHSILIAEFHFPIILMFDLIYIYKYNIELINSISTKS